MELHLKIPLIIKHICKYEKGEGKASKKKKKRKKMIENKDRLLPLDASTTTDDVEKADRSIPEPNPVLLLQLTMGERRSRGGGCRSRRNGGLEYRNRIKRFKEEEKVNI